MFDEPTTCSTAESPSLTLEELAATMRYLETRKGPHVTYQICKYVPEEIIDPDTGKVSTILVLPDALSGGRSLAFFNPVHEAGFVESCQKQGITAVRVDWKRDLPIDKWLRPLPLTR